MARRRGNMKTNVVAYNLDTSNGTRYKSRGLDIPPYFHGVTAFAMVNLSNICRYGAALSTICLHSVIEAGTYSCMPNDLGGRHCPADR